MTDLSTEDFSHKMKDYSFRFVGPVMFEYVSWILNEAQQRKIKRLYFLARDGYLLREIALKICETNNIDIECKYLFCSRQSLRTPSYHLIGDEAYNLLLQWGYYVTPKSVLERVGLSSGEQNALLETLNLENIALEKKLSKSEFSDFTNNLRNSDKFKDYVIEKSKSEYPSTINYFKQEGLFDNDYIAVVDSGWSGSMQRSLRQLMKSAGYSGKFVGFYFGMYSVPKDKEDGEYLTFYFNATKCFSNKLMFNNNLFECMLSAPHPMTVKYQYSSGMVKPVFAKENSKEMNLLIQYQINGALEYADLACQKKVDADYDLKKSQKRCFKLLKRAMVYPKPQEAQMYSCFMFCDDVTEGYHLSLADKELRKTLKKNLVIPRIFRKLFGVRDDNTQELLWIYGVIAFCPPVLRPWYRLNALVWDYLKLILKK